jgi:hypothetical protein
MSKQIRIAALVASGLLLAATASAQSYAAFLDGLQETPPNAAPGSGNGTFTLDGAKILHFNISFSGLLATETAAHIHGPAAAGAAAGVIFPLPLGSPKIGTVGPLNVIQEGWLNAGLLYVNVHTQTFPGGEIRGQIYAATSTEKGTWGRVKNLFR